MRFSQEIYRFSYWLDSLPLGACGSLVIVYFWNWLLDGLGQALRHLWTVLGAQVKLVEIPAAVQTVKEFTESLKLFFDATNFF